MQSNSGLTPLLLSVLCRVGLLDSSGSSSSPARETDRTAGLENRALLQMQQQVMDDQDAELAELEKTVNSTKVSSVAQLQTVSIPGALSCLQASLIVVVAAWWHSYQSHCVPDRILTTGEEHGRKYVLYAAAHCPHH